MTADLGGSLPQAVREWTLLRSAVASTVAYCKYFSKTFRLVSPPDWGSSSRAVYRFQSKSTAHYVDENDATAMASKFLDPPGLGVV